MHRQEKPLLGPRPADFSANSQENSEPAATSSRPRIPSGADPMLNASSRNNHSLFSFGGQANAEDAENSSLPYDFLPSVSFDDLQSSLTESNDLNLSQFPAPNGQGSVFGNGSSRENMAAAASDDKAIPTARASVAQRPGRNGSLLRRQSNSTRQSSVSSTMSGVSGTMDPPTAPLAMRTRRTSQYPPISGTSTGKAPRKSIGPGVIDSDLSTRPSQRRRPSLASSISANSLSEAGGNRSSIGGSGNIATDGARLATARAAKSKSLQPPPRHGPSNPTSTSTPDHNRSSSFATRSPGRPSGRGTSTPSSSAKRMSVMPGMPTSASHATGLGARTISPTDARRAKRLSTLHGPPPIPNTPPMRQQPQVPTGRASSRSPSMLPRKTSTPSSSRTTPDMNRKSYSSGLSIGSNTSFNTARTSTGSLQPGIPRIPQSASTSRLPTPKPRNVHSSAGNEDEDVPPVPAIPKAYESPKDSPAEPSFFPKRKTSLPFDASSINSNSTNELSGAASVRESLIKVDPPARSNKGGPTASGSDVEQRGNGQAAKKKNLQPLRLPPLNLLPLSMPTAAKIAALQDPPATSDGATTPPPRKVTNKTPSTPMTASKASFFSSRNRQDEKTEEVHEQKRSISSIHHTRIGSSTNPDMGNSGFTMPIAGSNRSTRQAVSPFISSSLPKNGGDYLLMPRSQTTSDINVMTTQNDDQKPPRLTGPRAQKGVKLLKSSTPTQSFDVSSPDEPTTPSSTSSLRRKLSLSWKRTTSKSSMNNISHAANERDQEYPPQPPKHDNMPPPRLPASATMNNLSSVAGPSPSPSVKSTTYLDSKRRKSSTSSLTMFNGHDRNRSDSWGLNRSPKKESSLDNAEHSKLSNSRTSSVLSPVRGLLSSKSSTSTLKPNDPWTVDLDKDDMSAEDEMRKLGSKRKETEQAARLLDSLRKRATPKDRVSPQYAIQIANLNIFERGEIVDYKDIYFCGTSTATKHVGDLKSEGANFGYDDDRGDYTIVLGDHLSFRYEIIDILGKGSFGQVVRCIDHKTGGLVAIKIIRNKKRFHQQALVEVNILQKLREWDPKNKHSMVNFTQSFYFRSHLCISTELLDMNLYEFIKSNGFRGFSLKLIRRFTKQLLSSLLLLKQHKVIHCDLKPENILLAHPMHSEIKVIDFGSSCFENEKVYTYIQSRFYRSPEVILGMTYGMPIDMWSVGCILAELFSGYPIFPGENEQEQLACIMEVFGPPEKHLIEKSTRKKLFFDSLGKPRLTVSSKGRRRKPSSKSLQQVLKCEDEVFLDFLTRCLRWDPDRRMKPDEAVRHEFLTGQKSAMPMARSGTSSRTDSPIKRTNTITTPSAGNRPLPEPPTTAFRNGNGIRTREPPPAASPAKNAGPRRQSTVSGMTTTTGSKRTSTGAVIAGGNSGLPRVTTRSASARQDALTGASAAMTRRAG